MAYPLYVVNAFTEQTFGGNPAAVMPLDAWLPDETLQALARQHNLSETAFIVDEGDYWRLRWFTPGHEVDLCGHATLATAFVLSQVNEVTGPMQFMTRSGLLTVEPQPDGAYVMDFPAITLEPAPVDPRVEAALGASVVASARPVSNPWQRLYRLRSQAEVEAVKPDFRALGQAADHAVVITAPGDEHDFVSRFFIPNAGIDEDPVTGSAHCLLTPYWTEALGPRPLRARQLSARGGELGCELVGERVRLSGRAVLYARGEILPAL